MTARKLLTDLYNSTEITEVIGRLKPERLREDIKQYVFLTLFEKEDSFILGLQQRQKLKHYVVMMMYNTSKWRDRSVFKKQFGLLETAVPDFEGLGLEEDKGFGKMAVKAALKTIGDNTEAENETVGEVLSALDKLYWYKAEVFKLYVKYGTYQRVSDKTGIPLSSIFQTVKAAKAELRHAIT